MLTESLLEQARAIEGDIVALRRAIHAEPELGLHTPLTRDKVRLASSRSLLLMLDCNLSYTMSPAHR